MKKFFKKGIILFTALILIIALFALTACKSDKSPSYDINPPDNSESVTTPQVELNLTNRKIVYNVNMVLTTKDYDATIRSIYDLILNNIEDKNWISRDSESVYGTSKTRVLSLRVKTEKLNNFLSGISDLGEVDYYNLDSKDITYTYATAQAEKSALEDEKEYYQNLLNNIDSSSLTVTQHYELLKEINDKLTQINARLRLINDELTKYDTDIEYSTIDLTIKYFSPAVEEKVNFGTKIKNAFFDSMNAVWISLKWLFIALIYILPYAIIIGGVAFAVFKINKKVQVRRKGKEEMKKIKEDMNK